MSSIESEQIKKNKKQTLLLIVKETRGFLQKPRCGPSRQKFIYIKGIFCLTNSPNTLFFSQCVNMCGRFSGAVFSSQRNSESGAILAEKKQSFVHHDGCQHVRLIRCSIQETERNISIALKYECYISGGLDPILPLITPSSL